MAQQAPCAPAIKCIYVRSSVGGALVCYAEGPEFEPQHWEKQVWWWTPAIPALRKEMEVGGTKLQGHPRSKFKACAGPKRPCLGKEKKWTCVCPQVHTHRETHVDTDPDSCLEQAMCPVSLHQQAYPLPQVPRLLVPTVLPSLKAHSAFSPFLLVPAAALSGGQLCRPLCLSVFHSSLTFALLRHPLSQTPYMVHSSVTVFSTRPELPRVALLYLVWSPRCRSGSSRHGQPVLAKWASREATSGGTR